MTFFLKHFFATGNIGYGKTASQSGHYNALLARLAVDGVGYGIGYEGLEHCAHPVAPSGTNAHWTVDLGTRHQILNVTIYNRRGRKHSLKVS